MISVFQPLVVPKMDYNYSAFHKRLCIHHPVLVCFRSSFCESFEEFASSSEPLSKTSNATPLSYSLRDFDLRDVKMMDNRGR